MNDERIEEAINHLSEAIPNAFANIAILLYEKQELVRKVLREELEKKTLSKTEKVE